MKNNEMKTYLLEYIDSATGSVEEFVIDSHSLWFPSFSFVFDFQVSVEDVSAFGAKCWRVVARSATYQGV